MATQAEINDSQTQAETKDGHTQAEINVGQTQAETKDGHTQAEINDGQKRINGKLCQVDWLIVEALKQVSTIIRQQGDFPDLAKLDELIGQTDALSEKVANEDPPGCDPRDRTNLGG